MRQRIKTFFLAMLAPFLAAGGVSCTGVCGNCQYSCFPVMAISLFVLSKKFRERLIDKLPKFMAR